MIDQYVSTHPQKAVAFTSMGHLRYLSCMRLVDMVIGNSSSGLLEAPSFGIPTVNIGTRQKGRIKAASVIDCNPEKTAIVAACHKALSVQFKNMARKVDNPYKQKKTAQKIIRIISSTDIVHQQKTFYDLPAERFERQL